MLLAQIRCFLWLLAATAAMACVAPLNWADERRVDAESRWATFESGSTQYFAVSVQADPTGSYPRPEAYEIVVLMDTSATQTGPVRIESMEVLEELASSLPDNATVSLMACDVDTVDLSGGLVAASSDAWQTAVARLHSRIPLGATNLSKAIRVASEQFQSPNAQKTIVYIGDGVNRRHFLNTNEHRQLVDRLVSNQITLSSLAIGPIVDVATLAALANQTGGVLYSRNEIQETTQAIGHNLGQSCLMPVVWVTDAQLPKALQGHFPQRFPPLRADRDSVIVGRSSAAAEKGQIVLRGSSAGQPVAIVARAEPEASHPDMGFLAAITESAANDGGLTMPALGSDGLRAMSYMLADTATSMVKSGQFALKAGEVESAIRIAEEALKSDPNNAEAASLLNAAKKAAEKKIPTGKFTQTSAPIGGNDDLFSETLNAGDLLAAEQAQRRVAAQALEADVRGRLRNAQELMRRDPLAVKNSLKLLLEELDSAVEVDPTLRAQLRDQVGSAIKLAANSEARYLDDVQRAETLRAQADQAQRLLAETNRRDESLKQLVEQFNFLMESQRYREANKDVAPEISRAAPDTVLDNVTREESSLAANYALVRQAFEAREQGFVDVMTAVEEASVPFGGDPPIVYPPPEVWQALTARRKERYGAINLAGGNESESKIYAALKQQIEPEYPGIALQQVITQLADELEIPIWINQAELDLLGINPDTPITLQLPPVSVRSALRLMLDPLELTYIIRNEVLEITSKDSAENDPINKVYPVGDLVVPPMPMGGMMGGMGGGMMGGMGGGMGGMGGMGGGMGGMGGMGGGMGGMGGMGGGMGGMFAVPDDKAKTPLAKHHSASSVDVSKWTVQLKDADETQAAEVDAAIRREVEQHVALAEAHVDANNLAAAQQEFEQVIGLVSGLLSAGYPQPWMYQALSLSMEACEYPSEDIKRVLLSSLDFEGSTEHSLRIAKYLAQKGMRGEALELLRDVAFLEPHRYDVFSLAMPLAKETQDFEALQWVCLGVLSKAWPKEQAALYDEAEMLAKVTKLKLAQEGRVMEANAFEEQVKQARKRDLAVRVTWTGDADLDIRVKEPAGTICSLSNPLTVSGGVLLGDTSSRSEAASVDGFSEFYVCSQGYAGQYDVLIRRVYGEVTGGKVTVEVYTDFGSPEETHTIRQIDLSSEGAMLQVAVKNGHREEPIAAAQLAHIRTEQLETGAAVLGQFAGNDAADSSSAQDYFNFRRMLAASQRRGFGFPVGGGAVGYRPVITTLPEGAFMTVTGVVSADRRYVRISPSPNFNGIGEIFTFNFVSGQAGTQGGGAGGGLGGGGLGGGGGGFGGGFGGGGGGF